MSADSFKSLLLGMSDREVDPIAKKLIGKWRSESEPTAIEVLEPLDMIIHGSLASGFVVTALQALYDIACKREGVTHEEVANMASWRHETVTPIREVKPCGK